VLDGGGAAGAYAFWLAELGYDVQLIDPTPRLIEVPRAWNETAPSVLLEAARLVESEPAMLGASAHLLAVARKPVT